MGGTNGDIPLGLKLDDLGNVYVMGLTASANFPVTPGAFHTFIHPSMADTFVMKLDGKTGRLKASTYLHAAVRQDLVHNAKFALDPAGGAFVAGALSDSPAFTTTPGVLHPNPEVAAGQYSTFFALRLNASLSAAVYATFLRFGSVAAVEADSEGNLILAGRSAGCVQCGSAPFPAVNPIPEVNQRPDWPSQAYVAKLNPSGTAIVFATLLHGDDRYSMISDMKLTADGSIKLLGFNYGSKFPIVDPIPYDRPEETRPPDEPVPFLARIGPQGGSLLQSTLFYGPEFVSAPSLAFPANLKLAQMPDGRTCMMNLSNGNLKQTPGGLGSPTSTFYGFGGTLLCLDAAGASIGTKTFLPEGAIYSEIVPLPGNTLLFSGTANEGFKTSITQNAYQVRFGGDSPRIPGYPTLGGSFCCVYDAFLLQLSLATRQPKVTGINPRAIVLETNVQGTRSFEVYGSDFTFGLTTVWNGESVPNQFVNSRMLRLPSVNFNSLLAGENRLQVTVPGSDGAGAEGVLIAVNATPERVTATPNVLRAGAGETKLVIRADSLAANSLLFWNGSPRSAAFVSDGPTLRSGRFELILTAEEVASPGTIRIAVSNPPPGGGMSTETFFAILPPAVSPLTVNQSYFVFSESTPAAATQLVSGGGFTPTTRIFWDGQEIPAEYVSAGSMRLQPPAADLSAWGSHSVYAQDGALRSAPSQVIVARTVQGAALTAYDPASRSVWCVCYASRSANGISIYDLLSIDARTGVTVNRIENVAMSPLALIVSTDGSYLYIGDRKVDENRQPHVLRRVNTRTMAIDLEWTDSLVFDGGSGFTLLPVPGMPETIAVVTGARGVYIYDRDRRRPNGGVDTGLRSDDTFVFATPKRIYVNPISGACWRWIEFDAQGPGGVTKDCASQLPPEVVLDGDVLYFRDLQRSFAVSIPEVNRNNTPVRMAVDPERRRVYIVSGGQFSSAMAISQYDMESRQQRVLLPGVTASPQGPFAIYADGDGAVVTSSNLIFRIASK